MEENLLSIAKTQINGVKKAPLKIFYLILNVSLTLKKSKQLTQTSKGQSCTCDHFGNLGHIQQKVKLWDKESTIKSFT